jgi:DNA-directed RNA polymerase specialized sigma24 family protein
MAETLVPILDPASCVDAVLVQIEPCIVALTRRITKTDLTDWEREEVLQRVRSKLAKALPGKKIDNLQAYLNRTVSNESISFVRQRKALVSLLLNDEGEPKGGTALVWPGQGMNDPQEELEQKVALQELFERLAEAILSLPTVQREAMICSLRERVDDPLLLTEAFKRYNFDITSIEWPADKAAKQRLQASCQAARRTLARRLNIDISLYKGRRGAPQRTLPIAV